jgi:glycerate kinase
VKVVLAPDSFKGSISARDLCAALREGVLEAFPGAEVTELPLADGGEGTVEALVHATGGGLIEREVTDPLGRPVRAAYGVLGDGKTAVVEMAQASGLPLLAPHERNPLAADSFGTGELIRDALRAGCRRFIIGLGGSATNDGGAGALRALGARFLDEDGAELPPGGEGLLRLRRIDLSALDEAVRESRFILACDVTNPLCGPDGASAVFGPQKGATPEMVAKLDAALGRFGEALREATGLDVAALPGSGAAGGSGAGFMAVLGAEMRSGIDIVMEAIDFERKIRGADWIVTGEGRLDEQTLSGKVVAGVCRKARAAGVPVIGLCGSLALTGPQMEELGLAAGFGIVPGPCTLEEAMAGAGKMARDQMARIMRLIRAGRGRDGA